MKRDYPRDQMPPHSAWNMVDLVLNYGAPVRQRGGWTAFSSVAAITAASASASRVEAGISVTFSSGRQNLCIDEDGHLFNITSGGFPVSIGSARTVLQNPVFHGGTAVSAATAVYTGLVIIPDSTGAAVPKKYDGATLSDLGGAPPKARYASVYKDHTLLGNGTVGSIVYPNRVWFSPDGDPDVAVSGAVTAWDTTDSWIDFSHDVKGFGATKSALLVFGDTTVSRIRGSTPPPDEDMVVDDRAFNVGLLDAFSIVEYQDNVFWCAPEGVFRSDGVILDDLTRKGGMSHYWLDLAAGGLQSGSIAMGIHRDQLFIALCSSSAFRDAFLVDLRSYAWVRLSNIDALAFWNGYETSRAGATGLGDELYFGRLGEAKVGTLDSIFSKVGVAGHKADGDGDNVLPVLETAFYEFGKPGLKRVKNCYTGYEITDYATDTPTAGVDYILSPEETSYTDSFVDLGEQTAYRRDRFKIGRLAPGIALKLTRYAAGDFLLYDLGFDTHPIEPSRLAQ
jgi:hypothetical protein